MATINYDNQAAAELLQERRDKRVATGFAVDPEMERLLKMRTDTPEKFEQIGPNLHLQLGYYQSRKAAAARLERSNR